MMYLEKIQNIILSPSRFFSNIKKEQGVLNSFKFYALIVFITTIVYSGIVFLNSNLNLDPLFSFLLTKFPFLNLVNVTVLFFVYWIGAFSISLISGFSTAAVFHIFTKIFGGKGDYVDTYKAYVYSTFVLSFNILSELFLFYSNPRLASVAPIIISLFLISWFLIVFTKGLKKLHDFETSKAVFSWALPLFASLIFLALVAEFILY